MDRDHLAKAPEYVKIIKLLDRIDNLEDMSGADLKFSELYRAETRLLAEAIGSVDPELSYDMLEAADKMVATIEEKERVAAINPTNGD